MYKKGLQIILSISLLLSLTGCGIGNQTISAKYEPETIFPYTDQAYKIFLAGGYFICQDVSENLYVLTTDGNLLWERSNCKYINCINGILVLDEDDQLIRVHVLGTEIDDSLCPIYYVPKIELTSDELTPIRDRNDRYGYLTQQGLWHIQPQFSKASLFSNGCALVTKGNSAILYDDGRTYPMGYLSNSCFHDNRLLIKFLRRSGNGYGYDYITEGRQLLVGAEGEYPFDDALDFSEGYAAVKMNGFWGYIDTSGKQVIDFQYLQAYSYIDGVATVVTNENKVTQINTYGNMLCEPAEVAENYIVCGPAHGGCYPVKTGKGQYNLINEDGKLIFSADYDDASWAGVWNLKKGSSLYDIYLPKCDKKFTDVDIVTKYALYGNTIRVCQKNGEYKLVDRDTGDVLIVVHSMAPFSEGLACAFVKGKWGYIDTSGNWVIAPTYRFAEPFAGGMANTDRGLIANPLIYAEYWNTDPLERARQLGIYDESTDLDSESITYEQFLLLVEKFFALIEKLESRGIYVELPSSGDDKLYSLFLNKFTQFSDNQAVSMHDVLSRQYAAMVIAQIANTLGKSTKYYYMPYIDSDTAMEECRSSIAYCSAFGLFDTNEFQFEPEKNITGKEAVKCILSFFETILTDITS